MSIIKSDLKVEVDSREQALYLAINYQDKRQELEVLGLGEVVHTRVHPTARKMLITTEEVLERGEKDRETVFMFNLPTMAPTMED